jgi:fructose-1,6-bisphosphatase/inositol monophosphatase family enzyme
MKDFYTQFKKTVDKSLKKVSYQNIKKDSSMLTKNDLIVQNRIILLIKKFFPEVKQFICEEKFNVKNFKKINFKEPFAIIDPIDGTENFFAENGMFGTLVSIN